MKTRSSGRGR